MPTEAFVISSSIILTTADGSIHAAHAAHAGVAGGHWGFGFLDVAEDALGGEEHAGDRGGVLQGHTGHLEAAFSRATRVTLAGSMTPLWNRFSYFSARAL